MTTDPDLVMQLIDAAAAAKALQDENRRLRDQIESARWSSDSTLRQLEQLEALLESYKLLTQDDLTA